MDDKQEAKRLRNMSNEMSHLSDTQVRLIHVGNGIRLYTALESIVFDNYSDVSKFYNGFKQAHALIKLKDR